ncbi:hypothetical protein [Metabacillus litoralis]|uniref:hypothetical protein n=1 Tax=Metabacillus litoralis TaxID=152268 RepID=UPI001CFEF705|nr:hypothetical protein [Metabacillus litoralis]
MDRRNQNSEVTPHPDGKRESIINDSLSTAGTSMGIIMDKENEFQQESNPFHHPIVTDPSMVEFEKLMRGKKVEE